MVRNFLGAVSLLALTAGAANSADVYKGMKDEAGGDVFAGPKQVNWTGFYVGVQGGYGNANHNLTVQGYQDTVGERCLTEADGSLSLGDGACGTDVKGWPLGAENGASVDLFNIDGINSSGFIGGGRVGFDLQRGRFVVGLLGGYDFSNMETTVSIPGLGNASLEKGGEWSLGARAGILLNESTLAYILAAYTQTEYDLNGIAAAPKLVDQDRRTRGATFSGVTVGGGLEHALTSNIFVGLEYTHTFYDTETIFDDYDAICNNGIRVQDDLDEDKIMATLKVKLNGGLGSW